MGGDWRRWADQASGGTKGGTSLERGGWVGGVWTGVGGTEWVGGAAVGEGGLEELDVGGTWRLKWTGLRGARCVGTAAERGWQHQ